MGWFEKLQNRWGVTGKQVILILIVFALTGSTIAFLKKPVVAFFTGGEKSVLFSVIYFILIFPVYILFLMAYGYLFGMYDFFKGFAKKSVSRFRKKR
ncbi:MAG TPA: prolipoprotein diacylglyceryl transferase [Flavobacteriales bacterium]|nr:prolipoprotein diacylglyceryl transferase [Flavobacteriales bacterium]|tara:strand:- start:3253 stop:3543 length:291 start_codon:yes stop_codon:yes gene_type:complete